VNSYEVAILRILIKSQAPVKVSQLIYGFPDKSEDNVLEAISNLHFSGYVSVHGSYLHSYISIDKDKRSKVIEIVDSHIGNDHRIRCRYCSKQIVNSHKDIINDPPKDSMPLKVMRIAAKTTVLSGFTIILAGLLLPHLPAIDLSKPVLIGDPSSVSPAIYDNQPNGSFAPSKAAELNLFLISSINKPTAESVNDRAITSYTNNATFYTISLGVKNPNGIVLESIDQELWVIGKWKHKVQL
jgi:hypothetical protein